MTSITKRKEIIFIYTVRDSNPNGDPDDENRPRTDMDGYNIVTDVRLKRTVRDYLVTKGENILIDRKYDKDGNILNIEGLITDRLESKKLAISRQTINDEIPNMFIDVRLFGLTAAVQEANTSITGPTQFAIGRSLNKPTITTHTITSKMSAGEAGGGGAMGTFHVLDYSVLVFGGVVCPHLAKISKMTEEDYKKLLDGMWTGTAVLNTRSKVNHVPQLILVVRAKNMDFLIGNLAYKVKGDGDKTAYTAVFDEVVKKLVQHKGSIEALEYRAADDLGYGLNGKKYDSFKKMMEAANTGIPLQEITP
jgi:CRISPR-associated protein Csh2